MERTLSGGGGRQPDGPEDGDGDAVEQRWANATVTLLDAPKVYETDHGRLCRRWRATSLATGWTRPDDWWTPEVEAVTAAVLDDEPGIAVADLGRARAEAGVGLSEALDDLYSLYRLLPHRVPPADVLRRLAEAWVETGMACYRATTCEDPLSGLASAAYLRTRLAEVYREGERCGRSPRESHALLLVRSNPPAVVSPETSWGWMAHRLTLGDVLRAAFSGGETFAAISAAVTVGLVARGPQLAPMLRGLGHELRQHLPTRAARLWLEGLPPGLETAYDLLGDLAR